MAPAGDAPAGPPQVSCSGRNGAIVLAGIRHLQGHALETTPMTKIATKSSITAINFMVGMALVVMLFPHGGKPAAKPAGVRTAIEMLDKRGPKLGGTAAVQTVS